MNCLVSVINSNLKFDDFVSTLLGSVSAIVLIQAIMYPFIFKYGMEKGRIILFVLSFAIVGIIVLFSKVINIPLDIISFFNNYWFIIVPTILTISLFISYKISEKIYLKKEF